jgi:hypothetical protein
LKHHIDEEEKNIFEELGEHFSDAQREQMADDFEARKARLLGRGRGMPKARRDGTGAPAARA